MNICSTCGRANNYHYFWCGKTEEAIHDRIKSSFYQHKPIAKKEAWIILVDGERIRTKSCKQVWAQIGHAKNALNQHMDMTLGYGWKDNSAVQQFISERIKFVRLEEYE